MMKAVLPVFLWLLLGHPLQAQQASTLWFYRPAKDNSNINPIVYLTSAAGARQLARLKRGQFFGLPLSPGIYGFSWTRTPVREEQTLVVVESGQQLFLEVRSRSIALIPTDKALADMRGISPVSPASAYDAAVIVPAESQLPTAVVSAAAASVASQAVAVRATAPPPVVSPETGGGIEALNAPRREQASTIWFYRLNDSPGLNLTIYSVVASGTQKLATLQAGEFFGFLVEPGIYSFSYTSVPTRSPAPFPVAMNAGQQVFLEVQSLRIVKSVPERALTVIQDLRPVNQANVFNARVTVSALPTQKVPENTRPTGFMLSACDLTPLKPLTPSGCKDLTPICECDASGNNCHYIWVCAK